LGPGAVKFSFQSPQQYHDKVAFQRLSASRDRYVFLVEPFFLHYRILRQLSSVSAELLRKQCSELELTKEVDSDLKLLESVRMKLSEAEAENARYMDLNSSLEKQLKESTDAYEGLISAFDAVYAEVCDSMCSGILLVSRNDGDTDEGFNEMFVNISRPSVVIFDKSGTQVQAKISFESCAVERGSEENSPDYRLISKTGVQNYRFRIPEYHMENGKWQWVFDTLFPIPKEVLEPSDANAKKTKNNAKLK